MLRSSVLGVPNLFVLTLCIQLASSQLPLDQVSTMTRVYEIFQNDTGPSFVWKNVDKDSNPCSWGGVNCSSDDSSIEKLSFTHFSISTSDFLPFLCSITTLGSLDVSNNDLTSIPVEFYTDCGKIRGLKLLNFSTNKLSGPLPTLNGFGMLEILDFSRNSLNGEINLQLDGLDSLKSLNLSRNQLGGTIPTNLGKMNLLEELRLCDNFFTGEIPIGITKYRNLSVIDLSVNKLSGSIPTSLSNITTLKRFAANQNQFKGTIPTGITKYLGILDLSYNKLTGMVPADLLSGPDLQSLDLSYNELQGPIPATISTKLLRLRLGSNSLNGTIPSDSFGSLVKLMYLELDGNRLSGEIPLGLGGCRKLALLNLAQNELTGRLPPILGELTNLQVLSLQSNNFVGEIPSQISQLNKLEKLNISRNSLNGSIPASVSRLSSLNNLDLQGNKLSGPIPDSIGSLSSLIELQLGKNQLSGRIPDMSPSLQIALNLSYNLFDGRIPVTLSKLVSLEVLDLSNNRFAGEIPDFLSQLGSLTHLLLSNNQLSGLVPKFGNHVVLDTNGNINLIFPRENPTPQALGKKKLKSTALVIVIAVASVASAVALLAMIAIFISRRYRRIQVKLLNPNRSIGDFRKALKSTVNPSKIALKTRFSTYYGVVMPSGTRYYIKKVNRGNKIFRLRSHERIVEELEVVGKLCNSNVMIPLAYFLTSHSAYLFYDFAPQGTLSNVLHRTRLDWANRFRIAVGVSQGLAFLHQCPILLLDVSSNSILMKSLDEPLIGDVELCKVIHPSKSTGSISTVAGSVGYVPPEYAYTMRVTAQGNVYSFGVVLLELLTGKPAISEGTELAIWVLSQQDKCDEILDVGVSNTSVAVRNQMLAVLGVAISCISTSPEARPNMVTVLQMLQNTKSYNGDGESTNL